MITQEEELRIIKEKVKPLISGTPFDSEETETISAINQLICFFWLYQDGREEKELKSKIEDLVLEVEDLKHSIYCWEVKEEIKKSIIDKVFNNLLLNYSSDYEENYYVIDRLMFLEQYTEQSNAYIKVVSPSTTVESKRSFLFPRDLEIFRLRETEQDAIAESFSENVAVANAPEGEAFIYRQSTEIQNSKE